VGEYYDDVSGDAKTWGLRQSPLIASEEPLGFLGGLELAE
jgi:hypothetical protein